MYFLLPLSLVAILLFSVGSLFVLLFVIGSLIYHKFKRKNEDQD